MLIPFNKIDLSNVNFDCFDKCDITNEEKLQALISKVCEDINWLDVDTKCLSVTRKDNPVDILNLVITRLCSQIQNTGGLSVDLSKINLCGKDGSDYTYKECLVILNTCFPNLTIEAILQAIIKRINNYSFQISQLKLQLDSLGQKYELLRTEITQIKTQLQNCC